MEYIKLDIKSIPEVRFAHVYDVKNPRRDYHPHFAPLSGAVEITYIQQGALVCIPAGADEVIIPQGCVGVFVNNHPYSASCNADSHIHRTVGLNMEFDMYPVTPAHVIDCVREKQSDTMGSAVRAIVPANYLAAKHPLPAVETYINRIIQCHSLGITYERAYCAGLCFEMLAEITRSCISDIFAIDDILPPSQTMYARKAMEFIALHIGEHIRIEHIAKALGISSGYLSVIFKTATGQTIVEYINRVKLSRVKELMLTRGMTFKQAGENVSICDESYLSRMFKKYNGISISEFISKGRING